MSSNLPRREDATIGDSLEEQVKVMIVEATGIRGTRAEDIDAQAPLFDEGLGLDSLDEIQIAVALGKRFGVTLGVDDRVNRSALSSVRSIADLIRRRRSQGGPP